MVLSGPELVQLINDGVINAPLSSVNGASVDVRLARKCMVEPRMRPGDCGVVDLARGETLPMVLAEECDAEGGLLLMPGQFAMGATIETLALPDTLCAMFTLRSSMGRSALDHMNAGWCDPGFRGTVTLEIKNESSYRALRLSPGMRIGQLTFMWVKDAGEFSYRHKGRYNGQHDVQPSLGH